MKKTALFIALSLAMPMLSTAQKTKTVAKEIKEHVSYLASDELEGRGTGTKGETLAFKYIEDNFNFIGLLSKGTGGFEQPFTFNKQVQYGQDNALVINGKSLEFETEFFPLGMSSNERIEDVIRNIGYGINAPELNHNDYQYIEPEFNDVFLIKMSNPEGNHPHTKFLKLQSEENKIKWAQEAGASMVIFYNDDENYPDPSFKLSRNLSEANIPVVFITKAGLEKINLDADYLKVEANTNLIREKGTGRNVVGYINNNAKTTVVIGAHYDHLGYGEQGGSLYAANEPAIHNGADDNASGTAGLLYLAKRLKNSDLTNNNYLFIAFSGEELGLLGSGHFVRNPTIDLGNVNYMLNMDMIGRLDKKTKGLGINGLGTSSVWKNVVDTTLKSGFLIKTTESGIGSSDHTSFYLKDIPVLHFFSGSHSDYHKPTDDIDKLNYKGEALILDYMYNLIADLNQKPKLDFTKTTDNTVSRGTRFTVTLGIMPDYLYDGKGLKVDGVKENGPGFAAGIKPEDVIIGLGQAEITDMTAYMNALTTFKKGEKTTVKLMRKGKELLLDLQF